MIGRGKEALINTLKEFSEITGSDAVIQPNKLINISVEKSEHGLGNFAVSNLCCRSNKPVLLAKGNGIESLKRALDECDALELTNEETEYSVLVCNNVEAEFMPDGTIASHWYKIPIGGIVDAENGTMEFELVSFYLDEEKHKLLTETNLALWNDYEETVYPVSHTAIYSIIRFTDGCKLFNDVNYFPITQGLVLAKSLEKKRKTEIRYKIVDDGLKQIVNIGPYKRQTTDVLTFVSSVISSIEKQCEVIVQDWKIEDTRTIVHCELESKHLLIKNKVDVVYENDQRLNPRVILKNEYNGVKFSFDKNTYTFGNSFDDMTKDIIKRLKDRCDLFEKLLRKQINYKPDSKIDEAMLEIYTRLGQGRMKELDYFPYGECVGYELMDYIASINHKFDFTEENEYRLEVAYSKLVESIKRTR